MATPIVEQIAQAIVARVKGVTKAAGYDVTVRNVLRSTRENLTTGNSIASVDDYSVVFAYGSAERNTALGLPGNPPAIAFNQQFELYLVLRPSDDNTIPLDQLAAIFYAEVMQGLTTDATYWVKWGGLAIDTEIEGHEPIVTGDGSYCGWKVTLTVKYRVSESDPYTQR